jgi:hypothetical protein
MEVVMPSADELWARVQAAEKEAQAALDRYEAFGVLDPSSEGSPEYEEAHAACRAAWVHAEGARHDLDGFLNPGRYAESGYRSEGLDGFRSRSEPDAKIYPGLCSEADFEAEASI